MASEIKTACYRNTDFYDDIEYEDNFRYDDENDIKYNEDIKYGIERYVYRSLPSERKYEIFPSFIFEADANKFLNFIFTNYTHEIKLNKTHNIYYENVTVNAKHIQISIIYKFKKHSFNLYIIEPNIYVEVFSRDKEHAYKLMNDIKIKANLQCRGLNYIRMPQIKTKTKVKIFDYNKDFWKNGIESKYLDVNECVLDAMRISFIEDQNIDFEDLKRKEFFDILNSVYSLNKKYPLYVFGILLSLIKNNVIPIDAYDMNIFRCYKDIKSEGEYDSILREIFGK